MFSKNKTKLCQRTTNTSSSNKCFSDDYSRRCSFLRRAYSTFALELKIAWCLEKCKSQKLNSSDDRNSFCNGCRLLTWYISVVRENAAQFITDRTHLASDSESHLPEMTLKAARFRMCGMRYPVFFRDAKESQQKLKKKRGDFWCKT